MPAGGDSFGGCDGNFGSSSMDSGGSYGGGHEGYNSNNDYSVSFTSIPGYTEGFYDGVLHIGLRAEFTREDSQHDNNPIELGITSDDFLNAYSKSLDSIQYLGVSSALQSNEFEEILRSASKGLESYNANVLKALSKVEALYNEYIKLDIEHKKAMEYYNGNILDYPGNSYNLMRTLDVALISIPAAKNEALKAIEEQKAKETRLKETEEKLLKEIFQENYSDIKFSYNDNAKIKNEIACIDIHNVLAGNPDMQYMSVKLYQHLLKKGLSENEALAILGNSLIPIHENPFAIPKKVNHVLALEGAAALVYQCTANPACVNLVASSLAAALATGKIMVEGFDIADKHDTTLKSPEQKHQSQDEEFLADTKVNKIPGFDWEQYFNTDEGLTIPEGIDMTILPKLEFDENGKFYPEKTNIADSEGGVHGGHSKERHVGKSDEYLKERAIRLAEKAALQKRTSPGASTFPDYKTANEATIEVLKQNSKAIEKWAKTAPNGKVEPYFAEFTKSVGYGYTDEGVRFESNKVATVLIKVGEKVEILTSYPVK